MLNVEAADTGVPSVIAKDHDAIINPAQQNAVNLLMAHLRFTPWVISVRERRTINECEEN